jgi:hypothetical protein
VFTAKAEQELKFFAGFLFGKSAAANGRPDGEFLLVNKIAGLPELSVGCSGIEGNSFSKIPDNLPHSCKPCSWRSKQLMPSTQCARKCKMDRKTAAGILHDEDSLGSNDSRVYRTRKDPVEPFWMEIEGLLKNDPKLKAYILLEEMLRRHPTDFLAL